MEATKRILFCATVDYHFSAFHLPYMKWFKEQGWEVHVAAAGNMQLANVDQKYPLPIQRSPFHMSNLQAYSDLKRIIDTNHYQLIHCHTPVGGVMARLAARDARKKGTKVIYTAHGFHFCNGAPSRNWIMYYPIEKWLAHHTDCLMTINEEDFQRAKRHRFHAEKIVHVHGVGVDTERFRPAERERKKELRIAYGYNVGDFLMFYAAEFNQNKNQQMLIRALAVMKEDVPHAKLLLAGEGASLSKCRKLAKTLGVESMVQFLGFRKDIVELLQISDVAVASSSREGLPVNILEAMSSGLPIIASENRGHRELVDHQKNGWLIHGKSPEAFASKLKFLAKNRELGSVMGAYGRKMVLTTFSINRVLEEKSDIYRTYMPEVEEEKWAVL